MHDAEDAFRNGWIMRHPRTRGVAPAFFVCIDPTATALGSVEEGEEDEQVLAPVGPALVSTARF